MLVVLSGVEHSMTYKGWARIPAGAGGIGDGQAIDGYWMLAEPGLGRGVAGPGPYRLEELRHPALLDGIISEIDAAD